jgi:BirA family transcriptional regulator, biotin operon repressor / biotin---[acetyl-CoA-carboxylase] ligase
MDENSIRAALRDLPLSGLRFFQTIGSTNDEALAWAAEGTPDSSLIVADEQTAGRGRAGRRWHTPPSSALAFSLILRPNQPEVEVASRLAGLGSLAVTDALTEIGVASEIKWPNDVVVGGRKVAGILAESVWSGTELVASVLGIGINVMRTSTPPPDEVSYPATTVEDELRHAPERVVMLKAVLTALYHWRPRLTSNEFVTAWQERLAYNGKRIALSRDGQPTIEGILAGLDSDGSLLLRTDDDLVLVHAGDVTLRPR